jgi:exosortase
MLESKSKTGEIALAIIIAIAILLLYSPSMVWMVQSWISSDYYSHGFLIPFVSGFLIWTKRSIFKNRIGSMWGIAGIVPGIFLYLTSLISGMKVLGVISFLIVLYSLFIYAYGLKAFKTILFPCVFLLFMVPFSFIQDLAHALQANSVYWAAWITYICGLPIKTMGTEIYLGNITFTIGIVCSGINTLVALMALCAIYSHILKGVFVKRFFLFILAFPIAILANVLRISSIILVAYFADVYTATGWYHDISSAIFFLISFLVVILIGRLMKLSINYGIFNQS